jgi:hypothetical protein
MIWHRRLKSKAAKYDVEYIVQENKNGLWTHKKHQELSYSFLSSSYSFIEKWYDSYATSYKRHRLDFFPK